MATSKQGGSRFGLAFGLLNLGQVLEDLGRFTEAQESTERSLQIYRESGHHVYITEAHSQLASIDLHLGLYTQARGKAKRGLELARARGPRYCVGLNLLLLGCLELAEGAVDRALQWLGESVAAYQEAAGDVDDRARALAGLALATQASGDRLTARRHLCDSLETALAAGAVPSLRWALPAAAVLLNSEADVEGAVGWYAIASRSLLVDRSRWFADVAGRTVAAAAARLPAQRVATLQEWAKGRELETAAAELLAELRVPLHVEG